MSGPTLNELLEFCMAQEVKIEFNVTTAAPGDVELLARLGGDEFSHSLNINSFSQNAEEAFRFFLERARHEFIRRAAARP